MIRLAILGSTGSIGTSTLAVVGRHPDRFRVVGLAANRSVDDLLLQAQRFEAERVVVVDEEAHDRAGEGLGVESRAGRDALLDLAEDPDVDVVVNAMVGSAGLEPTLRALRAGKRVALANKESLVAGGPLVMEAAREGGGELVPVDSEHSAILQCLEGYEISSVARIVLTASGGPFRGLSAEEMHRVTPEEALDHPTWSMGAKITVDSATLANKSLEVIEAHFLYGMAYDRIDAVIHPQSVIHSFVEFVDGSVLAQVGFPTMELPLLYALCYPERVADPTLRTFDPVRSSPLTFEEIDHGAFPLFGLGVDAGRAGGRAPAVYNAANEVAVEGFLDHRVPFDRMGDVVRGALEAVGDGPLESLNDVLEADDEARAAARETIEGLQAPWNDTG